jgi:Raf kinase inhibitor-like YbhB/YbcL family protein
MFRQPQQYFMKSGKGFVCGATFLAFFASVIWVVKEAAGAEALQLQVAGLKANEVIPQKFVYNHSGCSGDNISPEITWNGVPASAKSLALVVWDQDAPVSGGFYHWVILNVPIGTKGLAEGAGNPTSHKAPTGSVQLVNDWGEPGYGGPCPPGHSRHRYHFIVYALGVTQLPATIKTRVFDAAAQIKQAAVANTEVVLVYGH